MGLNELMRMIIIFVTFCLNKKKILNNHKFLLIEAQEKHQDKDSTKMQNVGLPWWRSG